MSFDNLSRTYYENALAEHGDTPAGVNWSTAETQQIRFEVLCGIGDLKDKKVHDVGCGLAHMSDFLRNQEISCEYIGSDISEAMVSTAKERIGEDANLYVANIRENKKSWMKADFVLNSGIFTVKGSATDQEWWHYIQEFSKHMFELCTQGIAFNLMTAHVDYKEGHLFYIDPGEVLAFCIKNLNRRVVIRHDYLLWEFTVYVYK